jgi:hypothetical protein
MNNVGRNWKTTVFGILMLALAGFTIYNDPSKAADPQTMGAVAGAVGLIFAKDGDKTGTTQKPATTEQGK